MVDDGSPEAPEVPPGVTLLRQEDRGFRVAAARNLGAARARGELLCFLDADTAPEPDYIRELTRLPALVPEAVTVGRRRYAGLAGGDGPVEVAGPATELPAPEWLERGYADSRDLLEAADRSYRYVIRPCWPAAPGCSPRPAASTRASRPTAGRTGSGRTARGSPAPCSPTSPRRWPGTTDPTGRHARPTIPNAG